MYKMKFMLFPIVFLFIQFCSNPILSDNSEVLVSFKNNSTHNLKNLTVKNSRIGDLDGNSVSAIISFDNFRFDTGMPDEDASAEVNGIIITNLERGYWCGTEKMTVDSGKYIVEIEIADSMLILICRNAPRPY